MRHASLIYNADSPEEETYAFVDQIVVGRRRGPSSETEGRIRIKDPAISGRHCVIRQSGDGKFYIRDESRNGTRVEGRRLVPNVEAEIHPGNKIQVGKKHFLTLNVEASDVDDIDEEEDDGATRALLTTETEVTILVGDIAGYTTLNQRYGAADVIGPVNNVFAELEGVVNKYHGSIKEYQGDAIFAFWELDEADPTWHTIQACHCALALLEKVGELGNNPEVWTLKDRYALQMEWAVTTGDVVITAIGGDRVIGLAMVGDSVNYAFRLEKLAGEENGKILACRHTVVRAEDAFNFRSIGVQEVKGRTAEEVFGLDSAKQDLTTPQTAETAMHEPVDDDDDEAAATAVFDLRDIQAAEAAREATDD